MRILCVLCMVYALIAGCQTRRFRASALPSQGAPVNAEAVDGFGLKGEMAWKSGSSSGEGVLPKAWPGDIWPILQGGLAHRFILPAGRDESLSAQLHLSPAEKYDRLTLLLGTPSDSKAPSATNGPLNKVKIAPLETTFWQMLASKHALDSHDAEGATDAIVAGLLKKTEADLSAFQTQREQIIKDVKINHTSPEASQSFVSFANARMEMAKKYWEGQGALNGLSRGWVAASLVEKAPQSAVLFSQGEEAILFTPSDIQGLSSFLWDEQSPNESIQNLFTCSDRRQLAEAWVCEGKLEGSCPRNEGKSVYIRHDDSKKGMLLYAENALSNEGRLAVIRQDLGQNAFSVVMFEDPDEFEAWFRKGGQGAKNKVGVMHISGCHSPSPLLFHRAVTRMSEQKRSLGMEMRIAEESLHLPIQHFQWRTIGAVGKEGVIRVDEISDALRAYRAPGTVYLVQVMMNLHTALPVFAAQPPAVAGTMGSIVVTYTLELDHEYAVIGGHWGWVPRAGEASFPVIGIPPPALWSVTKRGEFRSGPLDATLIARLQACSFEEPKGSMEVKTSTGLQKIPYVDCLMQQSK